MLTVIISNNKAIYALFVYCTSSFFPQLQFFAHIVYQTLITIINHLEFSYQNTG